MVSVQRADNAVDAVLAALRAGELAAVLNTSGQSRAGIVDCGVIIGCAETVTPEQVAFAVRHGSGLVSVVVPAERAAALDLPLMAHDDLDPSLPAMTVTVDATRGVTTGISARDRCATIALLAAPDTEPSDLARPGHIMPVVAAVGGSLSRPTVTEASLDLVRLAERLPAAMMTVVCRADGQLAQSEDLQEFVATHHLPVATMDEVVDYLLLHTRLASLGDREELDTEYGAFVRRWFSSPFLAGRHVALTHAHWSSSDVVPVSIYTESLDADLFRARSTTTGRLERAMGRMTTAGQGALVYLRTDGGGLDPRPVRTSTKVTLRACVAADVLSQLGIERLSLHTDIADQSAAASCRGLVVTDVVVE